MATTTEATTNEPAQELPSPQVAENDGGAVLDQDRLDVPGVIGDHLLLGSVKHAHDPQLLKHMHVGYVLDVENARKRSSSAALTASDIEQTRVELDDDFTFEAFKASITAANERISRAREQDKIAFVFCTHGNNESSVVCIAYLMLSEQWTLERAYKHVQQKRPASAPRRSYVELLRELEKEVHGHVTLRFEQVGPSMMDLMLGLRGEARPQSTDDTTGQAVESDNAESAMERASIMSNYSFTTGVHNGSSLRETMTITERDDESDAHSKSTMASSTPAGTVAGARRKSARKDCVIS